MSGSSPTISPWAIPNDPRITGHTPAPVVERPDGWPEKCGVCGADWTHIGFDYADGFNCRACGGADSDE